MAMMEHGNEAAPIEACGYLGQKDGVIVKSYQMTNMDQAEDHFTLDPAEQFKVIQKARTEGLEVGAVYHSHPESPARPSKEDIRLAADPYISYVIVSLVDKEQPIRSFKIKNGVVEPEQLEIID